MVICTLFVHSFLRLTNVTDRPTCKDNGLRIFFATLVQLTTWFTIKATMIKKNMDGWNSGIWLLKIILLHVKHVTC
jgi:hypothetical protein